MSKLGKFLAAAVLFLGLNALAQESSQPAPTPAPKRHQMRGDWAEQRLMRLSRRLSLTDGQKEKLRPILQDEGKQMKALDEDTALTPQQKHRKGKEIRRAARSQMDGILTDEQKQKLPSEGSHGAGPRHGRRSPMTPVTPAPEPANPQ